MENLNSLEVKDKINSLIQNSDFLQNENLKSAYLLGMLCAAINWQFGVSEKSSFANWLNNFGVIDKSKLDKIYKKCDETIRKVTATSNFTNSKINTIREILLKSLSKTLVNTEIVKASYVTVAFAMGGSDFNKHIKDVKVEKNQGEKDA
ncbi:hypothetical protein [Campylobacter corcagiensis]|uniref:hypothetical protein n=1 Tax=Campylobacter corcagiensis TaxID=1448857 RepID=UPI000471BA37|nr:hypothetical protein [Campylobacter corcagiensis]